MRIDREGFLLLAITTLAACEQAEGSDPITPDSLSQAPGFAEPLRLTARETVQEPHAPPPPPLSPLQTWFLGLSRAQQNNVKGLCMERAAHPCAGLWRMMPRPRMPNGQEAPEPEDAELKFLAGLTAPQQDRAGRFCVERSGMPAPSCETPLVVALDNQPVEFAPAGDAAFAFVPGTPMATAWPTAATPWIARDLDGDGAITSGAELFGSSTALDHGTATNGFAALASLDANHDGVIDARDPAFSELVLWADRDGDHRSSPGELRPLSQVITSIPLQYSLDPRCVANGACEGERGVMRWRDPTGVEHTGAVIDVYVPRR